ncbi:MFS transporter [Tardiphaga sp.]|jgi:DHA2 family multidrug resistance protein-like MFS transporter|uniref:MFS transporter n=1 Tax=Tardiphaga sp. TaxID=1926292 RepID=UPI0037D9B2C7
MADGIAAQAPQPTDGLTPQQQRWARAAIFTALAMASLDTAIANVALPTIAAQLKATPADVIWVVNVYQIAMVATLLPFGALGEIIGHQRIYLFGLVLFTVASVACALAWSLETLLIARILQGLGAAGAMSVNAALVRTIYPPHQFGRGLGHNALVVATSFTIGPTVASAILSVASWEWLFAINLPFGLAALIISLKTLPATPRATHRFDYLGALLAVTCLGLLITGIDSAAHHVSAPIVIAELIVGLLIGWVLLRRQAGHPAPMLPIDLFRRPLFALSAATAVCSFSVQGLAFVSLPFYFEEVLHRSAVETGIFLTPWPLVVGFMAPIAGRLSDRYPAGALGGIGLALLGIGMVLLATLPPEPSIANIVWRMVICGAGFGFFQAPNMKAIMSSAPAGRSGGASGIVATARLTGQSTGAALAAFCFGLFGHAGATWALALGAGFAAIGCVMSFLRLVVQHPTDA